MVRFGKVLVGLVLLLLLFVDCIVYVVDVVLGLLGVFGIVVVGVSDDLMSCDYWKYCVIDGWFCSCCGGMLSSCLLGMMFLLIMWIGICCNLYDGLDYIVLYNDCCGKILCGKCFCNCNECEKLLYKLLLNNDINWCMVNGNLNYYCLVLVLLGVVK